MGNEGQYQSKERELGLINLNRENLLLLIQPAHIWDVN